MNNHKRSYILKALDLAFRHSQADFKKAILKNSIQSNFLNTLKSIIRNPKIMKYTFFSLQCQT